MARKPRIEYEGAVYHVLSRGDRQEPIFEDDHDRQRFLVTLGDMCERTGWRIHAYVLMSNHFHCLVETPEANLVAGMKWLLGTYTQRYNRRHDVVGHLFQGRYQAIPVSRRDKGYFGIVSSYIHLNPARGRLVVPQRDTLNEYPWSSYPAYTWPSAKRPTWLYCDRVLGDLGLQDTPKGRRTYRDYMEDRCAHCGRYGSKRDAEDWNVVRRGWCLGSDAFKEELLERLEGVVAGQVNESHAGEAKRAHGERDAEHLVREGLKLLGLSEEDLVRLPKNSPHKCVLAWLVRTRTTTSASWVSERLSMGHRSAVSNAVRRVADDKTRELRKMCSRVEIIV